MSAPDRTPARSGVVAVPASTVPTGNGRGDDVLPPDLPSAPDAGAHPVEHVAHHVDTGAAPPVTPASTRRVLTIAAVAALVLIALFVAATLPRRAVTRDLAADAAAQGGIPTVLVTTVHRAAATGELTLPGTIEALHEGAIYARVPGYVRQWHADIGSLVHAGDVLADIDAPELGQEVQQGQQQVAQSRRTAR